ncbi:hypothetical protein PV327_007221 [Microctonus hyperodae]|uniref:Uncharacterized protein n=1 Tax=Microctonus hyperodae TaxID=165561 RepID=A0AA39F5X4_MICHY|nr:hypothetical protein PV327_007221 [Microctonus hyperodae]
MKQDSNVEEGKKQEKIYVNKQQLSGNNCSDPVTLDNIRKELISIEKKCEINRIKYDYLSGKNVKRLVVEYFDDFNDKSTKNKSSDESKVSLEAMKSSLSIPKTSSAAIGWRSSSREYNLEIFGPLYISPRHTIVPLTPGEIPHQRFIYLG